MRELKAGEGKYSNIIIHRLRLHLWCASHHFQLLGSSISLHCAILFAHLGENWTLFMHSCGQYLIFLSKYFIVPHGFQQDTNYNLEKILIQKYHGYASCIS